MVLLMSGFLLMFIGSRHGGCGHIFVIYLENIKKQSRTESFYFCNKVVCTS